MPLEDYVAVAAELLNEHLGAVELTLGSKGSVSSDAVSIGFGGEWPVDGPVALGWTSSDRRTILLNIDHPFASTEAVLVEIIAHELAHVLLGERHSSAGSLSDPSLDGRIIVDALDHDALAALTCSELP